MFIKFYILKVNIYNETILNIAGVYIMIFGYVRVSSKDQNEGRQIKALTDYCKELKCKSIYVDK